MKVLILAAGYATRLYPLTRTFPKALLKVDNKSIIEHIIDKVNRVELVDEIIIVTNNKFIKVFKNWKRKLGKEKPLTLVNDLTRANETRRGAIGDLNFAINKRKIKDDLLVIGGDNLFDGRLEDFLTFARFRKKSPVIGVYGLKNKSHANKYGVIKLDKSNRVADFQEKPDKPRSNLVGMCLYYFPKDRLGLIQEYLNKKKLLRDATGYYIDWLRRRVTVYGFVFKGSWFDIGDHKYYQEAKKSFIH
jgi:glucose-1-phosphate thymidylyltransferase